MTVTHPSKADFGADNSQTHEFHAVAFTRMSQVGRTLRIFRDGRKHERLLTKQLPLGAQANYETLAEMKKIVLADAREKDLKNFAYRNIIGFDKSQSQQVDSAFSFCRDAIVYESENDGFETVADLWSCLYALNERHPVGDCSIKSVALATCLSYIGLKPYFVVIRQIPNADFFNHVYVGVNINGQVLPLDPTPKNFRPGDELPRLQTVLYKIYD